MSKAPKTPAKPSVTSSVVFDKKGDINNAKANAKSWQALLNQQGYRDQQGNRLAEDGVWGPKTEYAWFSYQQSQAAKGAAAGGANYTQNQIKEGVAAVANNQLNNIFKTTSAGANSWTDYQKMNDPLLKQLEAAMQNNPTIKNHFGSPEKIRQEQAVLNALGYTGSTGKALRGDGTLDFDKLYAWDRLRNKNGLFGATTQSGGKTVPFTNITADIIQIQKTLNNAGYTTPGGNKLPENGTLDANTQQAIEEYLADNSDLGILFAKRKEDFAPRTNRPKGSDKRQPSGERERNVGHPKAEEHNRVPKGQQGRTHWESLEEWNEEMAMNGIGLMMGMYLLLSGKLTKRI